MCLYTCKYRYCSHDDNNNNNHHCLHIDNKLKENVNTTQTAMSHGQQQRPTDGDESATQRKQPRKRQDTKTCIYAEILKPKATRRPPTIPSRSTPYQETTKTLPKNQSSPRTDNMDGGFQALGSQGGSFGPP